METGIFLPGLEVPFRTDENIDLTSSLTPQWTKSRTSWYRWQLIIVAYSWLYGSNCSKHYKWCRSLSINVMSFFHQHVGMFQRLLQGYQSAHVMKSSCNGHGELMSSYTVVRVKVVVLIFWPSNHSVQKRPYSKVATVSCPNIITFLARLCYLSVIQSWNLSTVCLVIGHLHRLGSMLRWEKTKNLGDLVYVSDPLSQRPRKTCFLCKWGSKMTILYC